MKPLCPDMFVMDSNQQSTPSLQGNTHPYNTWPTMTMMPSGGNATNTSSYNPARGVIPFLDQWSLHHQALSSWTPSPSFIPLIHGTLPSKFPTLSSTENLQATTDNLMQKLSTPQGQLSEYQTYSSRHQVHPSGHQVHPTIHRVHSSGHQVHPSGHQGHAGHNVAEGRSTSSIAALRLKAMEHTVALQKGIE